MLKRRSALIAGILIGCLGRPQAGMAARYPSPGSRPGSLFADPNLKLAILSGLIDKGLIDLGTPRELAEHVLQRTVDLEREGYTPIPEVREYLARYPLTPELLQKVDGLVLDGGNSIYRYVWFFWDGEDNGFDIRSLAGIEHCPNIRSLDLASMIDAVDFQDLQPPFRIEHLTVGVEVKNIPALLGMPNLRSVRLLNDRLYDEVMTPGHPSRRVMEALKAKGVSVWVHWVSGTDRNRPAYQ